MSAALDRLRLVLGVDVDAWTDDLIPAKCPLCGHDYRVSELLRQAIGKAVDEAPEAFRLRSRRIEVIQAEMNSQQQHLDKQRDLRDQLGNAKNRYDETLAEKAAALSQLEFALKVPQLKLDAFSGSVLASKLKSALGKSGQAVQNLLEDTEIAQRRLQTGKRLRDASVVLAEIGERLSELTGTPLKRVLRPIPGAWRDRLMGLEAHVETARQKEVGLQATAAALENRLDRERDAMRGGLEQTTEQLSALRTNLADALEEQAILDKNWKALEAPEASPSEDFLVREGQTLERKGEDLERVEAALAEAERFRREADKVEEAGRECEVLDSRLAKRNQQLAGLKSWIDDLETGIRALKRERERYIRDQVEPLSDVISAIYRRAQGNEIIDCIRSLRQGAGTAGVLGWRPRIGGQELDIDQLSLGQRQDLALAIFLARTHSLRGSFFLDEPLIHLDDLNRVAYLDLFRVLVLTRLSMGSQDQALPELRLVITTASSALTSHFREKFSLVPWNREVPPLRIYELEGDPRGGVRKREFQVPEDPDYASWRKTASVSSD